MRILYLAGLGRNGSTIVSNVLGSAPGLFPVGEVRSIWSHGFGSGALCGCGTPIPECPFWSQVASLGGLDRDGAQRSAELHQRLAKLRHLRALASGEAPVDLENDLAEYLDVLSRLYRGVHEVAGCDVIVDSSKAAPYAAILAMLEAVDLRIVHQVRDVRASAHSWTRRRAHTDLEGAMMPRYPPWKTALLWNAWNLGAEKLRSNPYHRLRYEDFVGAPRAEIRRVLDFAGLPDRDAQWAGERSAAIGGHHMVHGNPSRGMTGPIELRPDIEWAGTLPRTSEALVLAMTLPLHLRYGYGLGRPRPHP